MRRIHALPFLYATIAFVMSACATSTVSTSNSTNYDGPTFDNVLVIGVANDFDGRARFERKLVSDLKATGVNAEPMYAIAGGNKPIEREAVEALVKENGYDAVLISRVLNRDINTSVKVGSSDVKAVRKDGRAVDLFRYDYEELNEPVTVNTSLSVTISTELFAAVDSQKVWSIELSLADKDNLEELINDAAETIVRRMKKDDLIDG